MKIKSSSSLVSAILLLSLVGGAAAGSPIAVISVGSGSGNPGDVNISIPIGLNSQDGAQIAGLNFDLSYDCSRLSVNNITIGSVSSSAGKMISWSKTSPSTVRVIIFGLNQDVIPNGTVTNVIFNVLVGAAHGTSPLTLDKAAATDPGGAGIGVNLNNGSFTVLSPQATNTPTNSPSDTPIATSTSTHTISPNSSSTPTMSPTIGPSSTGGPSTMPAPTKTDISSPSATNESKPTSSVTPMPNLTGSPEAPVSPTSEPSSSPTPILEGEDPKDDESAVEATGTAVADLEASVAATSTALAVIGQESTAGVEAIYDPSNWLRLWGDGILSVGGGLGMTLLISGILYKVWRCKVLKKTRKQIY